MTGASDEWREDPGRKCRGRTREFFLEHPDGTPMRKRDILLTIPKLVAECEQCPVLEPCQKDALATTHAVYQLGVQGGLSQTGRIRIWRERLGEVAS